MNIKENYHIRPDSHMIVGKLLGDLDNIYSTNSQVALRRQKFIIKEVMTRK